MKTTIDLPDDVLHRAKVHAAQNRTTLKELVIEGLKKIMDAGAAAGRDEALARLRKGVHLGGRPLSRKAVHERKQVS